MWENKCVGDMLEKGGGPGYRVQGTRYKVQGKGARGRMKFRQGNEPCFDSLLFYLRMLAGETRARGGGMGDGGSGGAGTRVSLTHAHLLWVPVSASGV